MPQAVIAIPWNHRYVKAQIISIRSQGQGAEEGELRSK